ncbi:MAG: hypothetical protein HOP13_15060 [Alphaproteobacteria bacterium]|nr:hypothetical protein [Alphaproteobacteria bacterium]
MRLIALTLLALAAVPPAYAWSGTTRDFLDRCQQDEAWCAREISDARRAVERGVEARKKVCFPPGMSEETLVFEVTYWIGEQIPSMDHRPHAESVAAAIVSLYGCDRPKGMEEF